MRVLRIAHHAVVAQWRERERRLRAQGVGVRLISAMRWSEGGRDIDLDPAGDDFVRGAVTWGTHPNAFVYDPRPIWRALDGRPDLIDLHEEPVSLATSQTLLMRWMRRMRTPYVLYSAQNLDKRYPLPFRLLERAALRGASGAYVCNREAGEILLRKGLRGPARLIPLGVDTAQFSPLPRTEPSARPVVAFIGRLIPHKGVGDLLHAAAARPQWRIEITGDGPLRTELERLAERLGIADRVAFLGFAQDAVLAERYRRADVVAIPSVPQPGWLEQFCRTAVEAMASGAAIVATRTGAIPDVVAEAGILVDPHDTQGLRSGIDRALEPATWRDLRDRGLARAAEFTWDAVASEQAAFYREIVAPRASGASRPPQVVVVAYGDPTLLAGALDALGPGFPITIVDNSSSAKTRALAAAHGAHYLDPGANLGFGAGVNVALRDLADRGLRGDDVLLLNPDARIGGDDVRRMQRRLHDSARTGVVGATQTEPGGARARVWWPFPSPARAWIDALGLGRLDRARGFAIGSVLLLRAEAIASVGLFDERFFLYAEEVDWQKRVVDAGWRIEVEDTRATHVGAGTGGDSALREAMFFASNEEYQRKHFGALGWQVFRAGVMTGALPRSVVGSRSSRAGARRRFRIFARGPVRHAQRIS